MDEQYESNDECDEEWTDEDWENLEKSYPQIFLKDPSEGLSLELDPNSRPIDEFMSKEEREEWGEYIKYLESVSRISE